MAGRDDLLEATALEPIGGQRFRGQLGEDWALWGPAGGHLAGLALRAAGAVSAFPRPVSLHCQFLKVARFGPVELAVTVLRRGRRSEALRVDMLQGDDLVLTAQLWAADRHDAMAHDQVARPTIPDPDTVPSWQALHPDVEPHPFMVRLDQRVVDPLPDDSGEPRPARVHNLFRFQPRATAEDAFADALRPAVLLDTFGWLATYPAHPAPGPSPWVAPNLDLYLRFHQDTTAHAWLYQASQAELAVDGRIACEGQVHALDGTLLVSSAAQLFCLPRPQRHGG